MSFTPNSPNPEIAAPIDGSQTGFPSPTLGHPNNTADRATLPDSPEAIKASAQDTAVPSPSTDTVALAINSSLDAMLGLEEVNIRDERL